MADRTERVELTNMCMVYDGRGNVLVQNRRSKGWPGLTFPGGHVEKGESFVDSVVREVLEETGLKIEAPMLCGVKQWIEENHRYMVLCYKAGRYSGEIHSSAEGEISWMPLADMERSENLASSMKSMLRLFTDKAITEEYAWLEDGIWKRVVK